MIYGILGGRCCDVVLVWLLCGSAVTDVSGESDVAVSGCAGCAKTFWLNGSTRGVFICVLMRCLWLSPIYSTVACLYRKWSSIMLLDHSCSVSIFCQIECALSRPREWVIRFSLCDRNSFSAGFYERNMLFLTIFGSMARGFRSLLVMGTIDRVRIKRRSCAGLKLQSGNGLFRYSKINK